jgi:hypothetical protein
MLCWPSIWNGFPIVFADTGTYLSQAIHHYAGWDRPVFYSLFMLPLHLTVTVWPVVIVQALLAAWIMWLVCRVLVPGVSGIAFAAGAGVLSACTWLPWIVSELMPDLFTPLLVLVLCLLSWVPERLSRLERPLLAGLATFMIASQHSSLPLACVLLVLLIGFARLAGRIGAPTVGFVSWPTLARTPGRPVMTRNERPNPARPAIRRGEQPAPYPASRLRRWILIILPPALAILGLCTVNLAAHGRFATAPFGNIFLLARVIYDGPGMAALRDDCPTANWLLCPFLDSFPPTSDDFLWSSDSPLQRAGGAKAVSAEAGAIIEAALLADPVGEARAALANTLEQMMRFASGDGLNPWPTQVSPTIERDFPAREQVAYASARQQSGSLSVSPLLAQIHRIAALIGVLSCAMLLPVAFRRRAACAGFLLAVLLALPLSAAITGCLSGPHDRYQARIMWLPAFIAVVSLASLRRRPA